MTFHINIFENISILVIGDVMLDQYTWGNVSRISPEAPVPVVRVNSKSKVIGGAANVASNLAGLGCKVTLIGLTGNDDRGRDLTSICSDAGIQTDMVVDPDRPTTTKTRIMASKQQLFRLDEEETLLMSPSVSTLFLERIEAHLAGTSAVILSDYGKGTLNTPGTCSEIIQSCNRKGVPCLVDPKGKNWDRYKGATCITPNTSELETIMETSLDDDHDMLTSTIKKVRDKYGLDFLLLTRGAKGMCVADSNDAPLFIPTKAREVFDVSGAGDTVIATLAAGIAAGLPVRKSAEIANSAAGIVVGKVGTRPVTAVELELALMPGNDKIQIPGYYTSASADKARLQITTWQSAGDTVVFTNGCFDLLHPGHVDLLYKARALGSRLIVGLNSDNSVKRLKGDNRPILAEQDRAAILSALACVDLVVLFDEDTPLELLGLLKPDILVKGADYKLEDVVGKELVESHGGKVSLVPLVEGYSTTNIEQRILETNKKG